MINYLYIVDKNMEKENFALLIMNLKKKGELSFERHNVRSVFDLSEIEGLSETEKWKKLERIAFESLKESEKIPTFEKFQDYERYDTSFYYSYEDLQKIIDYHCKESLEEKIIEKTFDNAFDNIILPDEHKEKIIETIIQLKEQKKIFEEWGLGEKIKRGKGVNIMFSGKSGTGKTYCAEIIGEYLGIDVEIVSGADINSKWIGESEKSIKKFFNKLSCKKSVLVIDEADSFLTARADISNNYLSQTNQLLIELENHNGICILTTNRLPKLDKALQRRIDLILEFEMPTKEAREKIWRNFVTDKIPKDEINFDKLTDYKINGGLIKNVILSSARKMIKNGNEKLTTDIIIKSIEDEIKESELSNKSNDYSK